LPSKYAVPATLLAAAGNVVSIRGRRSQHFQSKSSRRKQDAQPLLDDGLGRFRRAQDGRGLVEVERAEDSNIGADEQVGRRVCELGRDDGAECPGSEGDIRNARRSSLPIERLSRRKWRHNITR
jgi:hypothetical protein